MDKDQVKGKVKQVEGHLQEAKGDLLGKKEDRVEGHAKVTEGKIQEKLGDAKDAVKKAIDKL